MKQNQAEALKEIKTAIKERNFKIGEKTYAPLHSTNYPEALKELETKGFLARRGSLIKVLRENGLTYSDYIKLRGQTNVYDQLITCFEVLKEIV